MYRNDVEQTLEIRCDRAVTSGMDEEKIADYMEMLLKVFQSGEGEERKNANYIYFFGNTSGNSIKERFRVLSAVPDMTFHRWKEVVISGFIILLFSGSFLFCSRQFHVVMEELDTAWNDPQIVNPPVKVKEEIIRNRMKGYDVDGDMIGPNGIAGMDATDIPVSERHKIIEVSEKYRQMMFDETKRNFIQEYGVANGDTTRRSEVFESYQRSVRKKNRLKGSWTLGQYEQKYAEALEAVVKEKLPEWSSGEPFDEEIFESLSREKIDAAIVSDGVELSLKVEKILKTK